MDIFLFLILKSFTWFFPFICQSFERFHVVLIPVAFIMFNAIQSSFIFFNIKNVNFFMIFSFSAVDTHKSVWNYLAITKQDCRSPPLYFSSLVRQTFLLNFFFSLFIFVSLFVQRTANLIFPVWKILKDVSSKRLWFVGSTKINRKMKTNDENR